LADDPNDERSIVAIFPGSGIPHVVGVHRPERRVGNEEALAHVIERRDLRGDRARPGERRKVFECDGRRCRVRRVRAIGTKGRCYRVRLNHIVRLASREDGYGDAEGEQ
jgi:hypothetical protein